MFRGGIDLGGDSCVVEDDWSRSSRSPGRNAKPNTTSCVVKSGSYSTVIFKSTIPT